MEPFRDAKVEEQFYKLVKSFLSKNENYDMSRFIGGMPITLEKTDMSNLMLNNITNILYNKHRKRTKVKEPYDIEIHHECAPNINDYVSYYFHEVTN